jgi:hypothetical protein
MRIGGDFYHQNNGYYPYNFDCSGSHTVILNGTSEQRVTFSSSNSHFNTLVLTQDLTNYVFSPDKCWNTLVEASASLPDVEVTSVTLSARTLTLTVGKTTMLTASVLPKNATDQTLVWSSSDESVATVDQNGKVTAIGSGTATIRAEAANGLYRTCIVTAQEVFSGILTVGTVNALPGEEITIPVTVWDNPGFAAIRMTLTYDKTLLTLKKLNPSEKLSAENFSFEDHAGSCTILWYDTENMDSDGILFYMVFQVADDVALGSETSIELQSKYGDICMADHTNVSFSTERGSLLIKDVLKGDIYEDGEIDVHDILLLQRYLTGLETLSGRQIAAADMTGDGNVDMKDIVKLAQTLLGNVQLMSLDTIESILATDENLIVHVENATFGEDDYVDVPVEFSGCSGMAAFRLRVNYDTSLLELVSIDAVSDLVRDNLCNNLSDLERENTWITWYSANDQVINGTVFTLRFKLLSDEFNGILPVSLESRDNDTCTAMLTELPMETEHGIIHTASYSGDIQVVDVNVMQDGSMGKITGKVICNQSISETDALLIAAFYDEDGKMLSTWTETIKPQNEELFTIEGNMSAYSEVKLFILSDGSWIPLCPTVISAE